MSSKLNIDIIGATGNVGRLILEILHERYFPINKINLYASPESVGKRLSFGNQELAVQSLKQADFTESDIVFNAAGSEIAQKYREKITQNGAILIDKSSLFRLADDVPLIIPEINGHLLSKLPKSMVIANPNCIAIPMATILKPLDDHARISKVSAATYQSVSGAGQKAMDELYDETKAKFMYQSLENKIFSKQIAFNIIPQIGDIEESGYTSEEEKIISETQKIIGREISVSVTSVRVPVFVGHAIALSVEFEAELTAQDVEKILSNNEAIQIISSKDMQNITPLDVVGEDNIYVSRIRNNLSSNKIVDMWVITDNLRKGAALNGVQIAEFIAKKIKA